MIRGTENSNFDPTITLEKQIGLELLGSNANREDAVGMPKPLPKATDAGLLLELSALYCATITGNEGGEA
ncbi:MAG: hypothetical protein QM487_09445 [Candidatus Marithrix sp.]